MKTPLDMMEDISAQLIENASLLETIYKNTDPESETDCALACLIRALRATSNKATEHIELIHKERN